MGSDYMTEEELEDYFEGNQEILELIKGVTITERQLDILKSFLIGKVIETAKAAIDEIDSFF